MIKEAVYMPWWFFQSRILGRKKPLQTVLFVTDYCNLRCKHCTPSGHLCAHTKSYQQIKEELIESGYIRRKGGTKRPKITSQPFHYRSSDGYDIYVGKNNYQNDELTFRFASGNDWWFHAKGIPGSHVVLRSGGQTDLPDRAFEEAGKLAAYYSKGRGPQKIEIDYTLKKNVKKPGGSAPGFVVYYTNYSLVIDSDISSLTLLSD